MSSETPILKQNSQQPPERTDPHPDKRDSEKSWYQKWRKKWKDMTLANKLMVSFTGVIALCTVLYAGVAYFQWTALLESNRINRDALQSVQRAFVVFSPTAGMGTRLVGTRIVAFYPTIPITNTGNTPTREMKDVASIYVSDNPIGRDFPFPDTGVVQRSFLGPREPIHYTTAPVDIQTVIAAQQEKKHVYVFGWAKYRDVFRNTPEHLTEFCYELHIDRDIDIGDAKWTTDHSYNVASFNICPTEVGHNCADEECQYYEQKIKAN